MRVTIYDWNEANKRRNLDEEKVLFLQSYHQQKEQSIYQEEICDIMIGLYTIDRQEGKTVLCTIIYDWVDHKER